MEIRNNHQLIERNKKAADSSKIGVFESKVHQNSKKPIGTQERKTKCFKCGGLVAKSEMTAHMNGHREAEQNRKRLSEENANRARQRRERLQNIRAPHLEQAHQTMLNMVNYLGSMEIDPQPFGSINTGPIEISVVTVTNPKEIDPEKKNCVVCLNEFKIKDQCAILPCLHKFHSSCLRQWFSTRNTCPLCKFKVNNKSMPCNN